MVHVIAVPGGWGDGLFAVRVNALTAGPSTVKFVEAPVASPESLVLPELRTDAATR
jgi:hypothetical protein